MKIIEPSVQLMRDFDGAEVMKFLEKCGRTAYQSQNNITAGSAEKFLRNIIKRGHESVLEHFSLTFHIICDRAIQNELVRHRHASFTVESTRYVKYNEFEVIMPDFGNNDDAERAFGLIMRAVQNEQYGFFAHACKLPPEIARAVLPLCLKTELYMTANLREWRHILKLRTAKDAHPQMRQVANMILDVLKEKLPVIFEDIGA